MQISQGFKTDKSGILSIDLSNPFGFPLHTDSIQIGDDDHTENISIETLSNTNGGSEVL